MTTPLDEEARAAADRLGYRYPARKHFLDGYLAALASRVSTPPSEDEPVAWAIRGRATGRIREVTTDDEYAAECREFYDVIPLFAAAGGGDDRR